MTTIYICTSGMYSDYGIDAVFNKKELAERFCDKYGCTIEEWELNPRGKELRLGYQAYAVTMKQDGDTVEVRPLNYFLDKPYCAIGSDGIMCVDCWAKSEQHAVKITNEHRVQLIANDTWKPGRYFTEE